MPLEWGAEGGSYSALVVVSPPVPPPVVVPVPARPPPLLPSHAKTFVVRPPPSGYVPAVTPAVPPAGPPIVVVVPDSAAVVPPTRPAIVVDIPAPPAAESEPVVRLLPIVDDTNTKNIMAVGRLIQSLGVISDVCNRAYGSRLNRDVLPDTTTTVRPYAPSEPEAVILRPRAAEPPAEHASIPPRKPAEDSVPAAKSGNTIWTPDFDSVDSSELDSVRWGGMLQAYQTGGVFPAELGSHMRRMLNRAASIATRMRELGQIILTKIRTVHKTHGGRLSPDIMRVSELLTAYEHECSPLIIDIRASFSPVAWESKYLNVVRLLSELATVVNGIGPFDEKIAQYTSIRGIAAGTAVLKEFSNEVMMCFVDENTRATRRIINFVSSIQGDHEFILFKGRIDDMLTKCLNDWRIFLPAVEELPSGGAGDARLPEDRRDSEASWRHESPEIEPAVSDTETFGQRIYDDAEQMRGLKQAEEECLSDISKMTDLKRNGSHAAGVHDLDTSLDLAQSALSEIRLQQQYVVSRTTAGPGVTGDADTIRSGISRLEGALRKITDDIIRLMQLLDNARQTLVELPPHGAADGTVRDLRLRIATFEGELLGLRSTEHNLNEGLRAAKSDLIVAVARELETDATSSDLGVLMRVEEAASHPEYINRPEEHALERDLRGLHTHAADLEALLIPLLRGLGPPEDQRAYARLEAMRSRPGLYKAWLRASLADGSLRHPCCDDAPEQLREIDGRQQQQHDV